MPKGAIPSLGPILPFSLQPAPDCVYCIAAMGDRLWVLDGGAAQLLAYAPNGKRLQVGGRVVPPIEVKEPSRVVASGRQVAIVEGGRHIRFMSEGGTETRLALPQEWYAPIGFQMTPKRLFFTYWAWIGPGPEGSANGRIATLFSTNLSGSDVREVDTLPAHSEAAKAAGLWNAYSSWTEWPRHGWVLARTLPLRLYLFSADGRLLKRYPENPPESPPRPGGSKDRTLELLAMDRVIGLVPEEDFLGVVWKKRRGAETVLRVEWLDAFWNKAGEQEAPFPKRLSAQDNLSVSTTLPGRAALLLLLHGTGHYSVTSEVFEWPLLGHKEAGAKTTDSNLPLTGR